MLSNVKSGHCTIVHSYRLGLDTLRDRALLLRLLKMRI